MISLNTFDIILLIIIFALFGGAILRIGGAIVYGLLLLVGIVFLLRILGVLI